jgi:hypothetical protein
LLEESSPPSDEHINASSRSSIDFVLIILKLFNGEGMKLRSVDLSFTGRPMLLISDFVFRSFSLCDDDDKLTTKKN